MTNPLKPLDPSVLGSVIPWAEQLAERVKASPSKGDRVRIILESLGDDEVRGLGGLFTSIVERLAAQTQAGHLSDLAEEAVTKARTLLSDPSKSAEAAAAANTAIRLSAAAAMARGGDVIGGLREALPAILGGVLDALRPSGGG